MNNSRKTNGLSNRLSKMNYVATFLIYLIIFQPNIAFIKGNNNTSTFSQTQNNLHLIRIDASQIKNKDAKNFINQIVEASFFTFKGIENDENWDLRFRPDEKNDGGLIVEREGETLITELDFGDKDFEKRISEIIKREFRWQSLRYFENADNDSSVSIELKVVPIKNPRIEDGKLKYEEERADGVARGQLNEGDFFVFEIKNTGKSPAFVTIFDLDSGGIVKTLFPVSQKTEPILPGKTLRTNEVYLITPPYGLEVYKAFVTDQPVDLKIFERELPDAELLNFYTRKFFKQNNWGTTSLRFQIKNNEPNVLYQVSIGGNVQNEDKSQSAKDAENVSNILEKYSNFPITKKISLTDKNAVTKQIQASFENIIANAKPDDVFVFYFSGIVENSANASFDLKFNNGTEERISGNLFQTWLDKIRAKKQIVIFDSQTDSATFGVITNQFREDYNVRQKLLDKQTIVWTSIGENPKVGKSGVLATALSESLTVGTDVDVTKDGLISIYELESSLSRKSLELSGGKQRLGNFSNGDDFNIAISRNSSSKSDQKRTSVVVVSESDSKPKIQLGKSYALIFATNEYENYSTLKNPLNDAEDLGKTLRDDYGFEVDIRPNMKLEDVFDTLLEYQEKRKFEPNDQLLIFFAGHGTFKPKPDDMGYIIAKDSPKNGVPIRIYLSFSDLAKMVNAIDCQHILLILDVCQGGYFGQVGRRDGGSDTGDYRKVSADELISKVIKRKSRKYLTSAGMEYASDGTRRNSPFAYRLLEILRKDALKDENGLLTFDEIAASVKNISGQTPFSGEFLDNEPGSDFFFRLNR